MRSMILLTLGSSLLIACGTKAPPMVFCVIHGLVSAPYLECRDPKDGHHYNVSILESNKYIAQPPLDAQKAVNYVHQLESDLAKCQAHN